MSDDPNRISQYITPESLGKNDPKKPNNARPLREGLEDYSANVYYYWYEFFTLVHTRLYWTHSTDADYIMWGNDVLRDFDCRRGEKFPTWWERKGQWLFSQKYETDSRAQKIEHADEIAAHQNGVSIFFPLDGNAGDMLDDAKEILEIAQQKFREQRQDLRSEYRLFSKRYEIASLHNKLVIFKAVVAAHQEEPFGAIFSRIHEELFLPRPLKQMSPKVINDFMADNFDGACRLSYHVGIGVFPRFDVPEDYYNPRFDHRRDD